ncbi:MAG TPA: transposase [Chloroflexota bacterium]|nr:transposase [Chloroflexota bacterium]
MQLTVALKLRPTTEQATALRRTVEQANAAANTVSAAAWDAQTFGQFKLHKLVYADTRASTGLTAQIVVRVIAKVADAYTLDRARRRRFAPLGSVAYDDRVVRYRAQSVSIWTVAGRQEIGFVCGTRQRALLARRRGESNLVYRSGQWFLYATVDVSEPPLQDVADYLGVDLGIVNVAADSDGRLWAGGQVNGVRHRHRRLRRRLQRKDTRSARRLLRARRRKEQRFGTHVNHTLSKRLVAEAQGTDRGIALEDLGGIRGRVAARRPQRATLHCWAFNQLRQHIAYKARLAGVPVVYVDPRNTSRTCPACGLVDTRNRASQAKFQCVSCGLLGLADTIAARNIRIRGRGVGNASTRRGAVSRSEAPSGKCRPL